MNYGDFKTRVKLRLANMPTDDPWEDYVGEAVNQATNGVILRALSQKRKSINLFQELRDKWQDVTVLNQEYIGVPTDLLVLDRLYAFRKTSASVNADKRYPMKRVPDADYELMPKSTTTTGWPVLWNRYGNRIQVHPIPRTGYTSDVLMLGVAREAEMSADADTPIMDEMWHGAVEDYATWLMATRMNWPDIAAAALDACDKKIMQTIDVMGLERSSSEVGVEVRNDPARGL